MIIWLKKKIGDDITHCVYHVHYSVHNFYNLYFSLYLSPYLLLYYKDTHIIVYVQYYYISIMLYSLYDKGCHLASFICVVKIIYTCIYTTCNKDLLLTQSVTNEYLRKQGKLAMNCLVTNSIIGSDHWRASRVLESSLNVTFSHICR